MPLVLIGDPAVEPLEALRQRVGIRDRERALGSAPRDLGVRRRWREAERELKWLRRQFLERSPVRERNHGLGIEQ